MNITKSNVTKLVLSDLPNLDPIALYLEDYGKGAGKVIITCYSDSRTNFWSHMGEGNTLSSFMQSASVQYLADKFGGGMKKDEYDLELTIAFAKQEIIRRRKEGDIDPEMARDVWDDLRHETSLDNDMHFNSDLWYKIFGDEFWHGFQTRPTDDYLYLCRILEQVKLGLAQHDEYLKNN